MNLYDSRLDRNGSGLRLDGARADPYDVFAQPHQEELISPLMDSLQVLWRRAWIVVLVVVTLVGSAVGFGYTQQPVYEASARVLLIGDKSGGSEFGTLSGDIEGLQSLSQTLVEAVVSYPVARGVIQDLDLPVSKEYLLAGLNVQSIEGTQFIEVSYSATDPEDAQQVANAVGGVVSEQASKVAPGDYGVKAVVWQSATLPESPESPDPVRNVLIAVVLGLMLGVGLAFLVDRLDHDWRSPEEVEQVSGVPTLGVIPRFKPVKNKKMGD